ncbi:hypothetical protein C5Q97_17735 [Victivallales bacterium CCUG 44730]|nr:hypothetical protein C5Q97_17735 [Victivallales bacterium CCUG 44730]
MRTVVKYFTFSAFFLLHLTNRFLYYRKDVSQVFFPRPARPGTGERGELTIPYEFFVQKGI